MNLILRDRPGNQDFLELAGFIDFARERAVHRYLEIGCRNGDSFYAVMMNATPVGARGIAVDLPENGSARRSLRTTINDVRASGREAHAFFRSSRSEELIAEINKWRFDLILIDGDHRYEGVAADWYNYGHLAPWVAFHDVAAQTPDALNADGYPNGVPQFWSELKQKHRYREIINPGSDMGFGIIEQ
jgi:hypothetical protein